MCAAALEAGATVCTCGFKLGMPTQQFEPVTAAIPEVTSGVPRTNTPVLEVASGVYEGEQFVLGQGTFTLGRDPKCDVFLNNMTVSRQHASINVDGTSVLFTDLGSLNGSWVDGAVVDEAYLHPGSHIQIGTFVMIFKYKNA